MSRFARRPKAQLRVELLETRAAPAVGLSLELALPAGIVAMLAGRAVHHETDAREQSHGPFVADGRGSSDAAHWLHPGAFEPDAAKTDVPDSARPLEHHETALDHEERDQAALDESGLAERALFSAAVGQEMRDGQELADTIGCVKVTIRLSCSPAVASADAPIEDWHELVEHEMRDVVRDVLENSLAGVAGTNPAGANLASPGANRPVGISRPDAAPAAAPADAAHSGAGDPTLLPIVFSVGQPADAGAGVDPPVGGQEPATPLPANPDQAAEPASPPGGVAPLPAVSPGVNPADLVSRFAPFDSEAVNQSVDRFLGRLHSHRDAGWFSASRAFVLGSALAGGLALAELARRQQLPRRVSRYLSPRQWLSKTRSA